MALDFPNIDPIAVKIGFIAVRWYSLAYLAGIIGGWYYTVWLAKKIGSVVTKPFFDDYLLYATFGIILGGRLGYVLFYNFEYYISHPSHIFMLWEGGMSFHGGLLGVIFATWRFTKLYRLPFLHFSDIICAAAPIGLFFGRLANFVNGELYGRVTDVAWAVKFPNGGYLPRHPSQLYEAALEGLLLFIILLVVARTVRVVQRTGLLTGIFFTVYGASRLTVEFFREPDEQIGLYLNILTQGQLLCIPMILLGLYLMIRSFKQLPPQYRIVIERD